MGDAYASDPIACLQYGDTAGSPALRRAILRLMSDRGVTREVDDVIVTTGSQQGLDLLIKILVAPGDAVLIEEPAYPAAIQALRKIRCNMKSIKKIPSESMVWPRT